MWQVYLLIALAALGGGAYGVRAYNLAIEKATASEAKAAEFAGAYATLADGLQRTQQAANTANELAAKRNARAISAEAGRDRAERELERLKKGNSDVKKWADSPVPVDVQLRFSAGVGADGSATVPAPADGSSAANPKP